MQTRILFAIACALASPNSAQEERAGAGLLEALASSRTADELPEGWAAVGRGTLLSFGDLDRTLVRRHAMSQSGREILQHLVNLAVLERLGAERGIEITAAEMERKWSEIEDGMQAALGLETSLAVYLEENGVSVAEFRESLRLGLVHQRLTALALGLPEGRVPTPEEQEIWLGQTIEERGLEELPPPFGEGLAARCGEGVAVEAELYVQKLRENLDPELVDEAAYHLLLERRLLERVPALSEPGTSEADQALTAEWNARLEAAIDAELERRRQEAAANPAYHGIPYETLLSAQGFQVEELRSDAMVRVGALASAIVDHEHDAASLKAVYEQRADWFEGRFGEAVRGRYLLLRAAVLDNELVSRTFDAAHAELLALRPTLASEQLFADAAVRYTEDVLLKTAGGDLGLVHRDEPRVHSELRAALFTAARELPVPSGGRVAGPVRLPEGVALLWIAELRPSPGWGEELRGRVRQVLRAELVEQTLLARDVRSFLERN